MEDKGVLVRLPVCQKDLGEDAADVLCSGIHQFDGTEIVGLGKGMCRTEFGETSALSEKRSTSTRTRM